MDSETRNALGGAADEVLDLAERLVVVGEDLNKLLTNTETGGGVETREQWMRGARHELAELIRAVEGPKPRQGGRE